MGDANPADELSTAEEVREAVKHLQHDVTSEKLPDDDAIASPIGVQKLRDTR